MKEKIFHLKNDEPYVTLNVLLKVEDIISTGGEAKSFLRENVVYVNGEEENRRGRKLYHGDKISVLNNTFLID